MSLEPCGTAACWSETLAPPVNEGRILRLALAAAIALHLALLAALGLIPAWRSKGVDLAEIQVFQSAKAVFARPVEMVSLQDIQNPPQSVSVLVASRPSAAAPAPRTPAVSIGRRSAISPSGIGRSRLPGGAAAGARVTPAPRPFVRPALTPSASGGGGGGASHLLTAPAGGGGRELPTGGNTPSGQLSGGGTGSGTGSGSGEGGGSGSGSGSGQGPGVGSGGGGTGDGEGGEGGFVSRLADRSEPKVIHKGTFSYPPSAAEENVEGTVVLKALVDEKGRVADTEITSSAGDRRLDAAAVEWVKGWRYLPAVQDGQARRVWTKAKVTFRLE